MTYDGLGRLKSEAAQAEAAIAYTYDDCNNRAAMTVGGAVTTYIYDKNNRLKTETRSENGTDEITRYYYDNNGNQTSRIKEVIQPAGGNTAYSAYVFKLTLSGVISFLTVTSF